MAPANRWQRAPFVAAEVTGTASAILPRPSSSRETMTTGRVPPSKMSAR